MCPSNWAKQSHFFQSAVLPIKDEKLFEAVKRNKLIYSGHQEKISLFSNLFSSFHILNS
jgi:hypothetical protein